MRAHSRRTALAAAAIAVVLVFGLTTVQAQNKCLSGKTKCVNKKVAGLLKCREKCQKEPAQCGEMETACEDRVIAKFDGGTAPEKGCFAKLEAKNDGPCKTMSDTADMEAKVDAIVVDLVTDLDPDFVPGPRFEDTGEGTVIDHKTRLEWEKKETTVGSGQDYNNPHDVDNTYTWSSTAEDPDGTAFTDFLGKLNDCESSDGTTITGGFAGHCDWRLPTVAELQTILRVPYPCGFDPCIEPVFGPTASDSDYYWSSSTYAGYPLLAWIVNFKLGYVAAPSKINGNYVRAVRGGS